MLGTTILKIVLFSNWFGNPYKTLLADGLRQAGADVEELRLRSNFFLPQVLRAKPDVFHLQLLREFVIGTTELKGLIKFYLVLAQLAFLKVIGIKIAWTVHEWNDKVHLGRQPIPQWKAWLLGRFIDAFFVHCPSTGEDIASAFSVPVGVKVFTIYHGNYLGAYADTITDAQAKRKLGIDESALTFLLFGGIHRYKGITETIEAFLALDAPQSTLIIAGVVGDEALGEEILARIDGAENIVYCPGLVPDEMVEVYMHASDVVALPYQVFTTSGVAVLAMSFARPCIAPREGFFADVLDDEGCFFYDPSDPDALLASLREAFARRGDLAAMGAHNLNCAKAWAWPVLTRNMYDILASK